MDENGVKVGQIDTAEAVRMAEERMLDLVEVAPLAKPPVCRIMDYGKYRYQLQKKEKDASRISRASASSGDSPRSILITTSSNSLGASSRWLRRSSRRPPRP